MKTIGVALLCTVMTAIPVTVMARDVTIAGWGGNYQDAQREAYFKPFAEKAGVKIEETTYLGGLAEIKAMVDTGNVAWDFLIMGGSEFHSPVTRGCWSRSTGMRSAARTIFCPVPRCPAVSATS